MNVFKAALFTFGSLVLLYSGSLWADGASRCQGQRADFFLQAKASQGKYDYTYTFCEDKSEWGNLANTSYVVIRTDSAHPDDLTNSTVYTALIVATRPDGKKKGELSQMFVLVPKDSTGFTVEDVVTFRLIGNEKTKKFTARISTVGELSSDEYVDVEEAK